jgi:hypothetical protein
VHFLAQPGVEAHSPGDAKDKSTLGKRKLIARQTKGEVVFEEISVPRQHAHPSHAVHLNFNITLPPCNDAAEAWLKANIQYISNGTWVKVFKAIKDASVVVTAYASNPPDYSGLNDSLLRDWSAVIRVGNHVARSLGADAFDPDEDMSGAWVPTVEQVLLPHLTPHQASLFDCDCL